MNFTVNGTMNHTNGTSGAGRGTPPGQTLAVKIALVVIAVIALFGNGMVVFLMTMRRRLRTKTNYMVVSLAISDLFVAIAIIPSFLTCMYVKCDNNLSKLFYDAFLFISVCNLCCITFDRFLAVTRPLRYHSKMTRPIVITMIIVSWIVPSVMSIIPVTWQYTDTSMEKVTLNNKIFYTVQVVVFMFFPCIIMLVAYAVIFNIAWKQTRHMRHIMSSLSRTNLSVAQKIPNTTTREAKATLKVFGTVVLVFVLCWSLSAFRTIVSNYKLISSLPIDLIMTSRLLLVANSAINPIIYALWKKDVKNEIRKLINKNTRMVRPSLSFRSSQNDMRSNSTASTRPNSNAGDNSTRKTSRAEATPNVTPDVDITSTQLKMISKPLNGIVNQAVVLEDVENDVKSEDEEEQQPPEELTPSTLQCGAINIVCEIDGGV